MDSKILEYIIAIAEEKSVSRAADRFYLSQSVLSHHLKNLEEEFGEPFFARGPKGMQLTRAGIIFVNNARNILHLESQLEARMASLRRRQFQSIRVMIDSTNRNFFIRNILGRFREEFPQITLELIDGNFIQIQRTLQVGGADLAVCTSNRVSLEGCEFENLYEDTLQFLVPADQDLSLDSLREALAQDLMVCLHPVGTSMRMVEEEILTREKAFPAVIMESRSFQTSLAQAREGQCGIFYPTGLIEPWKELKVAPRLQDHIYFQLVGSGEARQSGPYRRLVEIIREAYQGFLPYARAIPTPNLHDGIG